MQLEIQVALNFFISFMYNKLPRRRVNIFADELERALRCKFASHWYPDRPSKGSAYRCLKTADPVDPVLELAASESGLALAEIRQNLPDDLSVWIDPGEVSYRVGERGQVKLLYSEPVERHISEDRCDREVARSTFNPDAQCFRPTSALSASMTTLALAAPPSSTSAFAPGSPPPAAFKSASPAPGFAPRPRAPVTFTTAAFAQTKFGSTKLKSSGKRGSRMSPTEFSNYIKQRALLQQPAAPFAPFPPFPQSRALSPTLADPFVGFGAPFDYGRSSAFEVPPPAPADLLPVPAPPPAPGTVPPPLTSESQQLLENMTYASNPHLHHLLVAN